MGTLGVVCLENWSHRLADETSVAPILDLLERQGYIKFRYRHVGTREDLKDLASQWTRPAHKGYEFGFFAFHGTETALYVGRNDELTLDDLSSFGWQMPREDLLLRGLLCLASWEES